MIAIVTGMIATFPVGGVAWDYGQYAIGLEKLGFEVYYLEDSAFPLLDPKTGLECEYGIDFLNKSLTELSPGMGKRWHIRDINDQTYGIDSNIFKKIIDRAELFLNVSGCAVLREEYMAIPAKILLDTDPGKNHFRTFPDLHDKPAVAGAQSWLSHDYYFTYAQNLGSRDCCLPSLGVEWFATVPPVAVERWKPVGRAHKWTTVMSWKGHGDAFCHAGTEYGGKEMEFEKIENLASLGFDHLEIAVGGQQPPIRHMQALGWSVVDSVDCSRTLKSYQDYIQQSKGEVSIAKNVYVATHSGWFSCRSVCYLASSRPVVVQDTGFSSYIPTGEGLFAFDTIEQAKDAMEKVEREYPKHQQAARSIACDYFDSDKVIGKMLEHIGLAA